MIKQLLIPVAAFAVTVTSAAAFGNIDWSEVDNDLTDVEISALEEVQEIREAAHEEVERVLEAAGIDETRMHEIREAMHEGRRAAHEAIKAAIEAGDYEAFLEAAGDSPMAEQITSEADFEKLVEAHELMESGDRDTAKEIMHELGIAGPRGGHGNGGANFGSPQHGARESE